MATTNNYKLTTTNHHYHHHHPPTHHNNNNNNAAGLPHTAGLVTFALMVYSGEVAVSKLAAAR